MPVKWNAAGAGYFFSLFSSDGCGKHQFIHQNDDGCSNYQFSDGRQVDSVPFQVANHRSQGVPRESPLGVMDKMLDCAANLTSWNSSSSCHATSTDIPDPLAPLLPIVHRFLQVLWPTSCTLTELLYVGSNRSLCSCLAIGEHHLWARTRFSSSVLHVWFV